ncbi:MAG TPA: hypothetical protein VKY57_13385 [Chitinispirillaceae bacterium]|nr:hypothetical protein [Chitinispirillaceae bacterium]
MSSAFSPIEEFDLLCRFCGKIHPAQLDRSIAENGRTVDRNSTFEYFCTKCQKTVCFKGTDLLEKPASNSDSEKDEENKNQEEDKQTNNTPVEILDYSPKNHYHIGEWIKHKKFKENGLIVGIDNGKPKKIIVNFEKSGIKKLIEDI